MRPLPVLRTTAPLLMVLMVLSAGSAAAQINALRSEPMTPDLTLEQLIGLAQDDLNTFWNREFTGAGWGYNKTFLMAPPRAEQADLHGYLSEGIRIYFAMPSQGNLWTDAYQTQWSESLAQSYLTDNPQFRLIESGAITFSGQSAMRYVIDGTDERISEPERTALIVIANPAYLLHIEVTSPVSKFEYYRHRLDQLVNTFTIKNPVAPQ